MNSSSTSVEPTGIQILKVRHDTPMNELAQAIHNAGFKPYSTEWASSKIAGKPIYKGKAAPGNVHMHLMPYYLINDPCGDREERKNFMFFGMGDKVTRCDIVPKDSLILVVPI
jgi:hypothetical protein